MYKLRIKEQLEELQEYRQLVGDVSSGLTLLSNVGNRKFKKFVVAYLVFWDDADRSNRDSTTEKTIYLLKRYNNNSGVSFDVRLHEIVGDTSSDFALTAPIQGANELWGGRNDEFLISIDAVALYADIQLFLRVM